MYFIMGVCHLAVHDEHNMNRYLPLDFCGQNKTVENTWNFTKNSRILGSVLFHISSKL